MRADLNKLHKRLMAAVDPITIFGANPKAEFRHLSQRCHPDLFTDADAKELATKTFSRLTELYNQLNGKAKTTTPAMVGKWLVSTALASGDLCDVYVAEGGKGKAPETGILKLARDEDDADLMDREVQALKKLTGSSMEAKFQKYIPALLNSFVAGDRRVNVVQQAQEAYPLSQLAATYDLSDFRHIIWMFNRLLTVLGFSHRNGIIHGAVTPDHLLYIPAHHGLVLVDWTASVLSDSSDHIPYKSEKHEHLYPKEVDKKEVTYSTDIYMAVRCIQQVVEPATMPKEFRPIFDYCLAGSPYSRPDDAWKLQHEWKKTAETVYGPPKFIDMKMTTAVS